MHPKDEIALEYGGLEDGESRSGEVCPFCQGGSRRERSFSISRDGASFLYICHRASCGESGKVGGSYQGPPKPQEVRVPSISPPKVSPLTEELEEYLERKYGLDKEAQYSAGIGWISETSRLYLPCRSRNGEFDGYAARRISPGPGPKALTYTKPDALAWYLNPKQKGLVIVEDQLSAIRASTRISSVALLGVHLNEARVRAIREANLYPTYLCLDADASSRAIQLSIRWSPLLEFSTKFLPKDLKDMTEEEFDGFAASLTRIV